MQLSVTVTSDLADVEQPAWDRLATSSDARLYHSYRWLRAVHDDAGVEVHYVLAYDGDELVGALPIFDVAHEGNDFYTPARHQSALTVDGHWLLAGTRRGYRNGLLGSADVLDPLLDTAMDIARERRARGLVWMFATTPTAAALRERGAGVAFETVDATITATSWDEYAAALPNRRLKATRRERRRFEAAGYDVAEQPLAACWKRLATLVSHVQRKYGHSTTEEQMRDVLARQLEWLAGDAMVLTLSRGGEIVAAGLNYRFGDTLHGRMVGFDYPRLADAYEYFNLVYYLPIDRMNALGMRRLHLGIESETVKVERGAQLDPLWTVAIPVSGEVPAAAPETVERAAGWRTRYGQDVLPAASWEVPW